MFWWPRQGGPGPAQLSKCALGSGLSGGQKPQALGSPKEPHADQTLARRGLLFCTALASPRQRASLHTRPPARRRQPGNVLWGRAEDSAEAPGNPRAGVDVIKRHRKCGGRNGATCEPRAGVRRVPDTW